VVLVWGLPADTARPFGDVDLRGAVVMHVTATSSFFGAPAQVAERGFRAGAAAWIIVPAAPPATFDAMARFALRPQTAMETGEGARAYLAARDSALAPLLSAAGTGLAELRAAGAAGARALSGTTATVTIRRTVLREEFAPNVVGILPGSDSMLRNEYVVFSAHMDHVGVAGRPSSGCTAVGADSICNGADDNASGTTGIVELAEAFSLLQPRPRRSTVFLLISGEERGLWGSEWYAAHPTVPMADIVANINMDMIGRNWRDTISVIGKEHSSLGTTANRVTAERPELGMRLVDDLWPNENFYFRSDHYNFARLGVPVLFFFNGTHPQYHRPSDEPALIDAEKAARIVRMVFYLGLDVANATERPQWNPESRARIVEAGR
jgi:Zn-dependent M28 family amino/carboxypeptidase